MTPDEKVVSIRAMARLALEQAKSRALYPEDQAEVLGEAMQEILDMCLQKPSTLQLCDDCLESTDDDPTIVYRSSEDVCLCNFCYNVRVTLR